ncbi:MAG TPA: hypothetical protein VGN63_00130 [Flavisolibacter sp.]|nr:hypothetical protein [Flavisolibacter sp.]
MGKNDTRVGLYISLAFGLMLAGLYFIQRNDESSRGVVIGLACVLLGALLARGLPR